MGNEATKNDMLKYHETDAVVKGLETLDEVRQGGRIMNRPDNAMTVLVVNKKSISITTSRTTELQIWWKCVVF